MSASGDARRSVGVVILTMGRRPAELRRALTSILGQVGVSLDVVVVGNGGEPGDLPKGVRVLHLPENIGIPAGRNAGAEMVGGEFICFVDDDSWLLEEEFLRRCVGLFDENPDIGMIQPRIVDPDRPGEEPGRWVPHLRKGEPGRSSNVFQVLETVVVLRRPVYDATGGWPAPFFYAHEGIELAWRVWDTGHRAWYAGDLEVGHPVVDPARHPGHIRMNARNRIWLARRCLPLPVGVAYVGVRAAMEILRWVRRPQNVGEWISGWLAGVRELPWEPGERPRKLTWRTVLRMARHGRPPII